MVQRVRGKGEGYEDRKCRELAGPLDLCAVCDFSPPYSHQSFRLTPFPLTSGLTPFATQDIFAQQLIVLQSGINTPSDSRKTQRRSGFRWVSGKAPIHRTLPRGRP